MAIAPPFQLHLRMQHMFLILLLISKYLSVPKLEYVYLVNPETKLIRYAFKYFNV